MSKQRPWDAAIIPVEGPIQFVSLATLKDMQKAVGGDVEVLPLAEDAVVYVNEDGKGLGLPRNGRATAFVSSYFLLLPGDFIAGPMLVSGPNDARGNETSIHEKWIKRLPKPVPSIPEE